MASLPLQTFPSFSKLPFELRHKVWQYALLSLPPRLLNLNYLYIRRPSLPVPTLLHTTRDSRSVALRTYRLWKLVNDYAPHPNLETSFYISLSADIFILDHIALGRNPQADSQYPDLTFLIASRQTEDIRHQIRHVVVDMEDWQDCLRSLLDDVEKKGKNGKLIQMLNEFTQLETLDISLERPSQLWQTKDWKLEELRDHHDGTINFLHTRGGIIRSLDAVEAFEMVRDAVPGWKIPVVRLVTAYNTSSGRDSSDREFVGRGS